MKNYSTILGKEFDVIIDRPLGSFHPTYPEHYYPINYGYISNIIAGDNEEQDVYVLGVYSPVEICRVTIIAVIHRKNDVEDKWVGAPKNTFFQKNK